MPLSRASTSSAGLPGWCGSVASRGPADLPPNTPRPFFTPDVQTLLCVAMQDTSSVDMVVTGATGGGTLLTSCGAVTSSGPVPSGPWKLQVGRTTPALTIAGPPLATFDSSQVMGDPPYLIEVIVNPDLSATIQQRDSLPELGLLARTCSPRSVRP